jgi:hypothetical protein
MALQLLRFNSADFCVRHGDGIISVRDGETKLSFECRFIKAWKDFSGVGSGGKCRGHVSDFGKKQRALGDRKIIQTKLKNEEKFNLMRSF